ncbi:Predicted PurR-regulated permease PerM [Halogranum amylolyticum]|uniref:Predicted PurR-regulated permease PerM n=1 Tax=Halogranum amylolyticum TaxID=660520 RepID=A0A1H8S212_9EURY|nr:AI-2E family transporter [Halogranum amylolyticum]SEO72999.1 Predicted PurR-regulated permease PerM [Halogranum amylolyticum]
MSILDFDRARAAWWALGAVLAASLLFVVYSFVGTFVFGLFLYYATRPIYRHLRTHVYPPSLAAAVSMFALALPALALMLYALLVVGKEVNKLTRSTQFDLGTYTALDLGVLSGVADPATLYRSGLRDYLTFESLDAGLDQVVTAADTFAVVGVGLVHLFVMVAIAFYLLRDDHRISRWVSKRFADDEGVLDAYLAAVDTDLDSVFFGNILNAVLTGTIGVIAYTVLNVFAPPELRIPAAALVGLLAGVASLVPVVGMKLVYVPVAGYMGVQSLVFAGPESIWFVAAFVVVSFVLVDTIPDLVLRPYVSGRSLHVGSVMLAYTFGPLLFGWYGIFLLPILLVLVVNFARIVLPELVAGKEIKPYVVDPVYLGDELAAPGETDGELIDPLEDERPAAESTDTRPDVGPEQSGGSTRTGGE